MQATNTLGRRKTSVARLILKPGTGLININGKKIEDYFPSDISRIIVNQPFVVTEQVGSYDLDINVKGGGITGQAEAIRLAISRALTEINEESKPALKKDNFLTRDSRMVERKKFGKKKARKGFQWVKR